MTVLGDINAARHHTETGKADGRRGPGSGSTAPELLAATDSQGRRVILVNRPNSVQTAFYVGNHAIDRLSPDYIAVQVLNRVLGGGPASRLFRNIREEKGYTYGISSGFSATRYINHFASQTSVRTEVTADALREMLKEFADIRDAPRPGRRTGERQAGARRQLRAEHAKTRTRRCRTATQIKEYGLPAGLLGHLSGEDRRRHRGRRAARGAEVHPARRHRRSSPSATPPRSRARWRPSARSRNGTPRASAPRRTDFTDVGAAFRRPRAG